jgi:hypothetical protein
VADEVSPPQQPAASEHAASPSAVKLFLRGQRIYGLHVLGLLMPGQEIPVFVSHQITPEPLDGWESDDLQIMIDEGRRQLDSQIAQLEAIRGRAQWLFTIGAAIVAALGGSFVAVGPGWALSVLWLVAIAAITYGVAGVAAIMTVRADFNGIDTAVLSSKPRAVLRSLAGSYSRMLADGENTVATRLTVFRQAVVFVIVGGYLGLLAVLIHR